MADQDEQKDAGAGLNRHEITLDDSGPVDWSKVMQELETEAKPASAAPAKVAAPTAEEQAAAAEEERRKTAEREEKRRRFQEAQKQPSMQFEREDLVVLDELSEIMSHVNSARNKLDQFRKKHAYLIAPNIFGHWEDNLKETATVMWREFHNLRNGRKKKEYDQRNICDECKSVFLVPLPADGICDECRARKVPRTGPY